MTSRPISKLHQLSSADRELVTRMVRKGATRREAMGWLMAGGFTAVTASSLFSSATQAFAQTPRRGGRLIFAYDQHGPNDTLDPASFGASIDYFRGRCFFGSLTRLTANLGYENELAEEVISNADATEWTFKLRRGVEFHNGKTMTADDVIFSMNRHLGADSVSKASQLVAMIERWEKVSDYEVRAVLSSPNADLPIVLGTFHFKIIPDGTTDFSQGIGTGPYQVASFQPGVRSIGARFDNYWAEGGYLDEIEVLGIGDAPSRVNAILAGDVDGIVNLPPKSIEQIEATEGLDVWSVESSAYSNIANRLDMQQSGNFDLIRSMQLLMDRQRLLKGTLKGLGTLGNDQPIGKSYFDHCPDIPQREFDPDQAKFHFDKSGIGSTPVPIVAADVVPAGVEQALVLQREAEKIGLNIDVQKVTTDGYWSAVWLKAPIYIGGWNMRPTANIMMTIGFQSDAKWNECYWKNEAFDDLLVKSRSVTDPGVRKQMYCDMQTLIHETGGWTIPIHRNYTDVVKSVVQGRTYVPLGNFGGCESPPDLWRADA